MVNQGESDEKISTNDTKRQDIRKNPLTINLYYLYLCNKK